jgi:hypothetical protein
MQKWYCRLDVCADTSIAALQTPFEWSEFVLWARPARDDPIGDLPRSCSVGAPTPGRPSPPSTEDTFILQGWRRSGIPALMVAFTPVPTFAVTPVPKVSSEVMPFLKKTARIPPPP